MQHDPRASASSAKDMQAARCLQLGRQRTGVDDRLDIGEMAIGLMLGRMAQRRACRTGSGEFPRSGRSTSLELEVCPASARNAIERQTKNTAARQLPYRRCAGENNRNRALAVANLGIAP